MKVSVIIPAYNEERLLPQCLESLMRQEVQADEIIVVDNNSRDRTAEIAQSFGVKVIRETQQGRSYARNAGFNAAQHEILARCDADSMFPLNWIKQLKQSFQKEQIVGLTGPVYFYDLNPKGKLQKIPKMLHTFSYFTSCKLALGHEGLFGSNMAIRKDAWMKIKDEVCHNDGNLHEDMDLAVHLNQHGTIKFDRNFIAYISARRVKSLSGYTDYPLRWFKSVIHAKKLKHAAKSSVWFLFSQDFQRFFGDLGFFVSWDDENFDFAFGAVDDDSIFFIFFEVELDAQMG